ncbi:hypothetical protein [Undibacterium umbellatum]|uniref:DUF4139 domain-containing protein n=1 Tax=Undibacterium umbellatum TaxID=2762300 RepID=A0ABR6Z4A1_9BURK|nr:hypothetical protein [Undibacterium umbellatum]MBC3905972.1 hypothetical protein [Undibacterium umbellatum]
MKTKLPLFILLSSAWAMAHANTDSDTANPEEEKPLRRHVEIIQVPAIPPLPPIRLMPAVPPTLALADIPDTKNVSRIVSDAMSQAFVSMQGMYSIRPIKNAPYSAEIVTEKTQTLADGNQISNKTTSLSYRDAAGRTRQEMRDSKGNVQHVVITDPVENLRYILMPEKKTATKMHMGKDLDEKMTSAREKLDAAKEKLDKLKQEGKTVSVETQRNGDEVIVKRIERKTGGDKAEGSKDVREEVQVRVIRAGNASDMPVLHTSLSSTSGNFTSLMALSPMSMAFVDNRWTAKGNTKDLGSRDIDGVRAEGKMRSYQIPAGEVGNKNPITVISENWYSPELQMTVYAKQTDPRTGEWNYKLNNLKRTEPAATLFAVPEAYTVKEIPATPRIVVDRREEKKP